VGNKDLALIQKTIEILDRYGGRYSQLSQGGYSKYLPYFAYNTHSDEQKLIKAMFADFLKEILGFPVDAFIPEDTDVVGERPDFLPIHRRLHPFVFEVKGSDERELSRHFKQLSDYVGAYSVKWGVLTNMRELKVYDPPLQTPIPDYSFSFAALYKHYQDHKDRPLDVLEFPNTKHFLDFCERFKYREVSQEDKIQAIREAKNWTGRETLDIVQLDRTIHRVTGRLIDDARDQKAHLPELLALQKTRPKKIATELEEIACQLDVRREFQLPDDSTLKKFIHAGEGTPESKAFAVYLARVAYFAMTRILLARVWEDVRLIDQSLYDGGFDRWYENFNRKIREVLNYAFRLAAEHYPWLYHARCNYEWFRPSEEAVIDALYEFSEFNLGKLDTDVLGTVYERYVEDRFERKQKGLFYTPREIIRFIWDRVGFTSDEAFFRFEEGKREPRYIFDPATGSGGFLVEAARRVIEDAHYDSADLEALTSVLGCLMESLQGSELSVFAHYITEVNLLIQFTPLIKAIMQQHNHLYRPPELMLYTVASDSMGLHSRNTTLHSDLGESNGRIDLTGDAIDREKARIKLEIKNRTDYDYCCSNPPYIGEKGHKELFRSTLDRFRYWRDYYRGKMDYFYWFVILGLSKLREGGKLGYITTHYWPTADGALKLRRYILDNALILEMIDFGEICIFDNAPGQHNMVFVLERQQGQCHLDEKFKPTEATIEKRNHRIKIVRVKKDIPKSKGNGEPSRLGRLTEHIQKHINKDSYEDEFIEVYWSPVKQGELDEGPWALIMTSGEKELFDKREESTAGLGEIASINCGIQSSADQVTSQNVSEVPEAKREESNIKVGDGIFVLSDRELSEIAPTEQEMEIIKPFYKNVDISSYVIERNSNQFFKHLIYTRWETDIKNYPSILRHLEKYRTILSNRRETLQGRMPWFSLHWPRDQHIFESSKLVCPHYLQSRPFLYSHGPCYTNMENFLITLNENTEESLLYLLGILNSNLLDKWYTTHLKKKASGFEFAQKRLARIPIRRIDFSSKRDVQRYDRMVELVKEMIETKKELAQYSPYYEGTRLTRLEGPEDLKDRKPAPVLVCKDLPQNQRRPLKLHPKLSTVEKVAANFILISPGKIDKDIVEGYVLTFRGKGKKQAILKGKKEFLKYLQGVLTDMKGAKWEEIKNLPVSLDTSVLNERIKEIEKETKRLLRKVRSLQKKIDELVYKLYDLTKDEIAIVKGENKGS